MTESLKRPSLNKLSQHFSTLRNWVGENPVFSAIILVWILITGHIFLNASALIADEYWYIDYVENKSISQINAIGNQFGYGQIFWMVLGGLINFTGAIGARVFFLILYILSPLLVMSAAKTNGARAGIFFLWLSTSMAWWYVKIISPEIIIIFLTCLSLVLMQRGRILTAVIIFAIGCSIKLSVVPFCLLVPFFILRKFTDEEGKLSKAMIPSFKLGCISVAVFLVCFLILNPLLFQGLEAFFKGYNLPTVGATAWPETKSIAVARIRQSFTVMRWGWDGVPLPGFFTGGFTLLVTLFLGLGFIISGFKSLRMKTTDWLPLLGILVALGILFLLVLMRSKFFTWYWFPAFVSIIYATIYFDIGSVKKTTFFVTLLAGINLVQHANVISDSLSMKYTHIENMQSHDELEACLKSHIKKWDAKTVLDYAEVPRIREYDTGRVLITQVKKRGDEVDMFFVGQRFLWKGTSLSVLRDLKNPYRYRGRCENVLVFQVVR